MSVSCRGVDSGRVERIWVQQTYVVGPELVNVSSQASARRFMTIGSVVRSDIPDGHYANATVLGDWT